MQVAMKKLGPICSFFGNTLYLILFLQQTEHFLRNTLYLLMFSPDFVPVRLAGLVSGLALVLSTVKIQHIVRSNSFLRPSV